MSQPANRPTDPESGDRIQAVPDDQPVQLQSPQNQPSQPKQEVPNFGDSSGLLFSFYSKIAEEKDKEVTEQWHKVADSTLTFTGLFSATVAALLAISVQDLRPNSQDTSAFYLANIYQIFANPNTTLPPIPTPSTLFIPTLTPFSPPRYAIWVNSLWFLSLVISLTYALLAISLQQWSRIYYIRVTRLTRRSPEKRARTRAFFARGVDKMHLRWVVETMPALIHLSLFLFFAGLVIFLFNTNYSVFLPVICWIGCSLTVYGCLTTMPIFWHESPFFTPLSPMIWSLYSFFSSKVYSGLAFITSSRFVSRHTWRHFRYLSKYYRDCMFGARMWKAVEKAVSKWSLEIDRNILDWTIGALGEDDTLEQFFDAIPGFFNSQMVKNLKGSLPDMVRSKIVDTLAGLLSRNLSSDSVSTNEEIKVRRIDICMNAAIAFCDSRDTERIARHLFRLRFDQLSISSRTAGILERWCTRNDFSPYLRLAVTNVLLFMRRRDDHWIAVAKDQFGMPEDVLRDNIAHDDDSVLLAILIHKTRQIFLTNPEKWWILPSLSQFDIHNTLPGLQTEFCVLWNEIVQEARRSQYPYVNVLNSICHYYLALHPGTDVTPTTFDSSTEDFGHSMPAIIVSVVRRCHSSSESTHDLPPFYIT